MAQYDSVLVPGFHRVLMLEQREDGSYEPQILNIYPNAEATVVREYVNGDTWVIFPEWPFRDFVFKRDELIYLERGVPDEQEQL